MARIRAACTLLFLAVGVFLSWELPEAGFTIPLSPVAYLLLAATLGAIALGFPLTSRSEPTLVVRTPVVRAPVVLLCCGVCAFGLGWGQLRLRTAASELSLLLAPSSKSSTIRLTILENPRTRPDATSWSCLVRVRSIVTDAGSTPINRNVWLTVKSATPPRPGDRRIAIASFRPIEPPRNPGEFDLRRWANDRAIDGSLFVASAQLIRPDESPAGFFESFSDSIRRMHGALRARASDTVDALAFRASPDAQQLLRGLLLGENPPAPSEGLAAFYQLGLAHILSISGFHLMVFAAAALLALRLFGDLGRLEPLLVAGAILFFLAIVPASSPLVRAATILLVLLGAECFGRRYDRLTLLCWTAVAVLLFRPSELWSLGFQLSFGLTAALLALGQRLTLRLFPTPLGVRPRTHWMWSHVRRAVIAIVVTGMLCWALSAPWIASNVGIFNPLSILTAVFITPFIVLALWIGYGALILGMAIPPLAPLASAPIGALADFSIATARWWDSLHVAVIRLPPLSPVWAIAATTVLTLWFVRGRLRLPRFVVLAGVLVVWGTLEMILLHRLPSTITARVYLLDESPANCTIIRTHHTSIMVNAGTSNPTGQGRDLAQVARRIGAWRLDTLILDASDPLAATGAPEVIRNLRPSIVIIAGEANAALVQPLISTAGGSGAEVRFAKSLQLALEPLGLPLDGLLPHRTEGTSRGMAIVDILSTPQ
ncbi:MAG: ComEC family competence protein [Phycisphaerales bacterium]|nr:ComEC family competence protein [Phycisphaerales bacterium]